MYHASVHKHNRQFVSAELLFVACFGERDIATIVAKLFGGDDIVATTEDRIFESSMHKKKINLKEFARWVDMHCKEIVADAKAKPSYAVMKESIAVIVDGVDIWDGTEETKPF